MQNFTDFILKVDKKTYFKRNISSDYQRKTHSKSFTL